LDSRTEKIGYKIRSAETEKVPYMLVIGRREVEQETVSLRVRGQGDQGSRPLSEAIPKLKLDLARPG
jgi:threonyl-tRNA synthetase